MTKEQCNTNYCLCLGEGIFSSHFYNLDPMCMGVTGIAACKERQKTYMHWLVSTVMPVHLKQ